MRISTVLIKHQYRLILKSDQLIILNMSNINFIQLTLQINNMQQDKLNLNDLLSDLQEVPQFIHNVNKDRSKKIQKISKKRQEELKRVENYNLTKEQLDKWQPIVKTNRQKDTLNFQAKDQTGVSTVNFFPNKPINDFHKKVQDKLGQMNAQSDKQVIKHEQSILEQLDPEQAKRRLIEARKHRTAVFFQQIKRRRIAKIKSKLYRKIKKRQRTKQDIKRLEQMGAGQRQEYMEKLTKNRIKERINLRHKTKNKHIQNLLRFNKNEKNNIQKSINEVNEIRAQQLEKINDKMIDEISEEYDDENFREQAIKDLQAEIAAIERGDDKNDNNYAHQGLSDLKFIQVARERRKNQEKQAAKKLLKKVKNKEGEIEEQDLSDGSENQQQQEGSNEDLGGVERKVYGRKIEEGKIINPKKNKTMEDQLNKYLVTQNNNGQLIEGINIDKLKQKYQPERVDIDLSQLIANNREIYEGHNQATLENVREFQQQKIEDYQRQIEPQKKKSKGWGSWAGPGIQEKKPDPKEELKKKLKKIQELKKQRKDSSLAHVTINETRNKTLSDYFVRNLPHNYSNADQFDYLQNQPVGAEWNSFNQFKDNIAPKVKTKAGQVIKAVQLPKKIQKISNGVGYCSNA